ncbi:MAG: SAM-dependent methyltransferase [Candidatus Competibacteraceae bacterium]
MAKKAMDQWQFGDFQTPDNLAKAVVKTLIRNHTIQPDVIIEPSCGKGAFIRAAAAFFIKARLFGFDINADYVAEANASLTGEYGLIKNQVQISQSDFFDMDWETIIRNLPGYILIIGNPPWVTSSELGLLNSTNLPLKSNFQNQRGIAAITGSSNFDISEWMLLRYVDWLLNRQGAIAVLCKYSVARKVMRQIMLNRIHHFSGHIYPIDAKTHFNAAVDACLFVITVDDQHSVCKVYEGLDSYQASSVITERNGFMVKDVAAYERWLHLAGQDMNYIWRSGAKHDCSNVMELEPVGHYLKNGLGEQVDLENDYLYPLLKSSDIGNGRVKLNRRLVLITQHFVGEETSAIAENAPKTWRYLSEHLGYLEKRASSIYKNKPLFSIFGIGYYTFKEWKIAISGLYKKLKFMVVGPINNRPVIFDDTIYFLSFDSKEEAEFIYKLISSDPAREFLESMIFWDEKRPITAEILRRMSLKALAKELALEEQYFYWIQALSTSGEGQLSLGIAEPNSAHIAWQ